MKSENIFLMPIFKHKRKAE